MNQIQEIIIKQRIKTAYWDGFLAGCIISLAAVVFLVLVLNL